MTAEGQIEICKKGGGGWFLPLAEGEQDLDDNLRAVIYAIVMIYFFLGVSVIADLFMESIEKIASTRRQIWLPDGRRSTVKVWNETVATLSLMALGSSAPEIFLSMMDSVKKEFHFGVLGPSTIVGSAAFNLLVIVAVCILAIPSTEVRRIKDLPTFYITAIFSIVAYVWMVLILVNISEDEIEIWEAAVTFILFFVLIWVSYKVDIGHCDFILRRIGFVVDRTSGNGESRAHIAFKEEAMCIEGSSDEQTLEVWVVLSEAPSEEVTCTYRTEAFTAIPGYDYTELEGKLEFSPGRTELGECIRLPILPKGKSRTSCKFFLILEEVEGGAEFNPNDDGGDDSAILTITIAAKSEGSRMQVFDRLFNCAGLRSALGEWVDAIISSFFCNGSREEQRDASITDWFFHIVNFPWKFMFAFVPPSTYAGGWISFFFSLLWIAVLSAILSDLAEMFGCVLEVPDIMTAITFVALGTSMPDLFASLSAARQDPTADASVVNVTGSNAVNVFLGLGVPWTTGSLYWAITGRTKDWEERYPKKASEIDGVVFVVDSTNLGFSVLAFIMACVGALTLLYMRRRALGGELGGHFLAKISTAATFIFFWVGFVGVVSWRSLRIDEYDGTESMTVIFGVIAFETSFAMIPLFLLLRLCRQRKEEDDDLNGENGQTYVEVEESTLEATPLEAVPPEPEVDTHAEVEVTPLEAQVGMPLAEEAAPLEADTPDLVTAGNPSPNRTISTLSSVGSRGWTVDDESRISITVGSSFVASLGMLGRGPPVERVPSKPSD